MESDRIIYKTSINESEYFVQPLHQVSSLTNECCELINSEWKRSFTARLRSIEQSNDNFPMSLLLIKQAGEPKVVGHCKISRIPFSKNKLFVDSVVIHKSFRGQGLGKFLMSAVEEVAKRKNFKWILLTTKGQEIFYEKLGYVKCPPFSIFGSSIDDENDEMLNKVDKNFSNLKLPNFKNIKNCNVSSIMLPSPTSASLNQSSPLPCPPPPPPPPPSLKIPPSHNPLPSNWSERTFMKKEM